MQKLNCLIVDDEPLAREAIADYCQKVSFLSVVAICKNMLQVEAFLKENTVDLIFLDIQMPRITGIEWLQKQEKTPLTIMTTAYSEYALESYNYNVIDYLVKPISFERFVQAVEKAQRLLPQSEAESTIFLKDGKSTRKVHFNDILFIEAQQNYIKVVTTTASFITHQTLKTMKSLLPQDDFIQPHKSYIVAVSKIDQIVGYQLHINSYQIPLSTRLKKEVLERLKF